MSLYVGDHKEPRTPGNAKTTEPESHVFISYVHDDFTAIQKLYHSLRENGVTVWLDRNDITPGTRWKRVIRKAIAEGGFFLACFSSTYTARAMTYMNEELAVAIDRLRKIPLDRCWFIPVLLDNCEIPELEISATETIRDIQQVRLYPDWNAGIRKLVASIKPAKAAEPLDDLQELSILFVAANPYDTARLGIDRELREIQGGIISSQSRRKLRLDVRLAVKAQDIGPLLKGGESQIIHFSGSGGPEGMYLEGDDGFSAVLTPAELTAIFDAMERPVECVVFNFSEATNMAIAIGRRAKYIVAMNAHLADQAAIAFAAGFYKALGDGHGIEIAFDLACSLVELEGFPEEAQPTLIKRHTR